TRVFHYDMMRTNAFGGSGSRGQSQGNRNGQHDLLHGKLPDWRGLWRIPPPKDVTAITKECFCRGVPRIRRRESRSIRPVEQLDSEPAGTRTQDPVIKSHVLYRLSYGLSKNNVSANAARRIVACVGAGATRGQ